MNHGLAWLHDEFSTHDVRLSHVKGKHDYAEDPVGYARNILKIKTLSEGQIAIADGLRRPPYRVMAKAGHKVGKSMTAGWLINWFYDSFRPGMCISTAPTLDSVKKIVWKEVRLMRLRAGLSDLQPKSPEMSDAPDHIAYGMTASCGEGFQGHHEAASFFLFDEACAIDPVFWNVTRTMYKPELGHMWLALLNPTDTTSQAFLEDHSTDVDGQPIWTSVVLDCLKHPNIIAQLAGLPPPIPAAVTLPMIDEWVAAWCDEISQDEATASDLQWPPADSEYAKIRQPRWYRQGPEFQARCRGMWPEGGTDSVWSEIVWRTCEQLLHPIPVGTLPELGVDVASYGKDMACFHIRWGHSSHYHKAVRGWGPAKIFNHVKFLCGEWAGKATQLRPTSAAKIDPRTIPVKIDDDGEGRAISELLQQDGYNIFPIGAATKSISGLYPIMRHELWFQTAKRAREGEVGLGRLPRDVKETLRQQAMTVSWKLDGHGRRMVEPKEYTKEKIGRSPDDMDAMNLAYLQGYSMDSPEAIGGNERRNIMDRDEAKPRRKLFG